jgi:hypothetical protein
VWSARRVGLDFISIAVPLDAAPVQAIRADAILWELADVHPPFSELNDTTPQISRDLLTVVPGGAGWVSHFDDRSHQQAEYLLDPARYREAQTWEDREQTQTYRILFGDMMFAEHAQSGQGMPWRYSTAAFLRTAVDYIDNLDVAAARREFSVAEMADLGVYKVHREDNDDQAFARVLGNIRRFAEHCRSTAGQGLDLIITLY